MERADAVLARLQGLDPTGVYARDVRECLMLQLAERSRLDPAMQALVARASFRANFFGPANVAPLNAIPLAVA